MTAPTKNVVDLATASTLAGTDKVVMVDVSDTTEGPLGTVKIATITSLSAFFDVISAQGLTTVTNNSGVFVNSSGGVTSGGGAVNYDSGGAFLSSIKIGGSAASNAFSDYERGTWTPTAALGTPGDSSTSNAVGAYVKVGDLVHVSGRITITKGTGSGDISLGVLPFTPLTLTTYQNAGSLSTDSFGVAGKVYQVIILSNSTSPLLLSITQAGGAAAQASASDFGASAASLRFSFCYQTA